jgi:two-component system NtrC family sensor kinase
LGARQDPLQALIAASPLAVVGIDRESRVTLWNPAATRLFGWSEEEALGERVPFVSALHLEEHLALRARVLAGESLVDVEAVRQHRDGASVEVSINVAPIRDDAGQTIGMVALFTEIGERRRATRELQALVRSERLAAVGALAAGVSHEFNNASAIVLGFTQLALGLTDGSEPLRTYLERIRGGALRVRGIARKLLDFANPPRGRRAARNLSALVEETVELIRPELESSGIALELKLATIPDTTLDPGGIGQLVLNLLINARDALLERPERRITVETGASGRRVWVRVTDTGCGIPPEHIPLIFTPFFSTKGEHARGQSPQSRVRGTGLGLSVSYTAAKNHGGALIVESEPERGSSFTLFLPILEPPAVSAQTATAPAAASAAGGRVLIVDDEPDLRELLAVWIRGLGFEALTTDDAGEALHWIEQGGRADVVLLDLQMPKMSGVAFLKRAVALGSRRPPVIVITGQTQAAVEIAGLPIDDMLIKPFGLEELRQKLATAVAGQQN